MELLLTGAYQYSQDQLQLLKDIGYNVDFLQRETDKVCEPDKYDAVVCNNLFLHNRIDEFKNLKIIQLTSAGTDRFPEDYAKAHGIKVYNAGDTYAAPIAEFAIMRLLEIYKNSMFFYDKQQEKVWEKNRNLYELNGKRVGIVGFGNIGKEIAVRLKSFGMSIIAINRSIVACDYIDKYVRLNDIYDVLSEIDVLFICIALTPETRDMIDKNAMQAMKNNAVIINVSRGGIIDEDAIRDYLNGGKFMGCALDVFRKEPLEKSGGGGDLWKTPRLLISPHISFISDNIRERLFGIVYRNL